MKATARIRMKMPSERKLDIILSSLEPEAGALAHSRSRINIEKESSSLVLKVESKDTTALRSALNSYLRWINSILNIFDVLERQESNKQISPLVPDWEA